MPKEQPQHVDQKSPAPPAEEGPRNFSVFLAKLADGEAHATLSAELWELGKRLQEEAHIRQADVSGKLTFVLAFKAKPNGVVDVAHDVTVKAPKPKRAGATFWFTKGGNLAAEPQRQIKLPFQDVANERGIPRDLDDGAQPAKEV